MGLERVKRESQKRIKSPGICLLVKKEHGGQTVKPGAGTAGEWMFSRHRALVAACRTQ